jgi:fucose permease
MIRSKTENTLPLTIAAFSSLGMVGIFHTILGTALPAIRASFEVDVAKAGLLGSASWLGFTSSVFAGGALSDIFERHRLLLLACLAMGLSAILLGRWRPFSLNCILLGSLGAGTGMIVSSSSALLMSLNPGKEGRIMNLHHFFYAIGAIAGPLVMGYALNQRWHWQSVYVAGGVVMLMLAGSFALVKRAEREDRTSLRTGAIFQLLKDKKLILLILITLLGVGTQNGIYFWLVSFLREVRSLPIFLAGLGLSLFSSGMAAGRLLSGWLVGHLGDTRVIVILLVILNLALFLFLHIDMNAWILVICLMAGIACSGLFPGLLALGGRNFPQWSGTTVGILGTAAGLGSSLMPWIMSAASQTTSLKAGFLATHMAALVAFGLIIVFYRRFPSPPPSPQRGEGKGEGDKTFASQL